MSLEQPLLWQGGLPTDTDTSVLYGSKRSANAGQNVVNWVNSGQIANRRKRLHFRLFHSNDGTVQLLGARSASDTLRLFESDALTAGAKGATLTYFVAPFGVFELRWVNGGVTQTIFVPYIYFDDEQINNV